MQRSTRISYLPGLVLCLFVALLAEAGSWGFRHLSFQMMIEPLVLAIGLGVLLRTVVGVRQQSEAGIAFSSKTLLELAIVLMGATMDLRQISGAGGFVLLVVAGLVISSIAVGFAIGRLFGLSTRLSLLVACGNAICGNSAIAAVAPVIAARREEVASALAFTAVLGIAVVIGLPIVADRLGLNVAQYGAMAGLTVYAVPQVLAAAAPGGLIAMQTGTLVKLLRVLMLGPVIMVLGIAERRRSGASTVRPAPLMPWFILGFLLLGILRTLGVVPEQWAAASAAAASALTVVAMAGLGLSVDLRAVLSAGGRVMAAAALSLLALSGASYAAILALPVHAFG
jgi:uncharacterized integral membrane protein (TIGR00698 family)